MFGNFIFLLLIIVIPSLLPADEFSNIAESRQILDYPQLRWAHNEFPVKLSLFGYVKGEGIFDNRQNFTLRDGYILYYPLDHLYDPLGKDINARGDFDEYALQSRLDLTGVGPEIWCMQSSFKIEADFVGRTDINIDSFDLREAFLELKSDTITFIAGQTWHPLCLPAESPDTVSYSCGIPICPYAFSPQFRIEYRQPHWDILTAICGFLGDRPFGPDLTGDKAFRDSKMPDLDLQVRFKWDTQNYVGATFDINRIVPRLVSNLSYKEVKPFTAVSANIFARVQYDDLVLYAKYIYSQDASLFELIGGYGVHNVDPATDIRTYAPLRTAAAYIELIRYGAFEPGLFIGVVKNLGASTTLIPIIGGVPGVFGLGTNISTVFRISPRARWYFDSFVIGMELEYTRASYGTISNTGKVINTHPVGNTRFLFATYYFF